MRLRSGTVVHGEISDRERRWLECERKRELGMAFKSSKITSSSDAIDTDEVSRHTKNILARVNFQTELDESKLMPVEIPIAKLMGDSRWRHFD